MSQRPSRRAWKLPTASHRPRRLEQTRGGKQPDTGIHSILPFQLIARTSDKPSHVRHRVAFSRSPACLHCRVDKHAVESEIAPPRAATQTSCQGKPVTPYSSSPVQQQPLSCLWFVMGRGGAGDKSVKAVKREMGGFGNPGVKRVNDLPLWDGGLSMNCPLSVRRQVSGLLLVCTKLDFRCLFSLPRSLPC